MGGVALVVRTELRNRWRRMVVLAVLIGVLGALLLATAAGARRTTSALARFESSSRAADIELDTSATPEQIAELTRLPGVAALASLQAFGLIIPQDPTFQSIGAPDDGSSGQNFGQTVDRDRYVAGRAPDPNAVDEVTLGEGLAAQLGLHVGDHLTVVSYTPAQIAAFLRQEANVGPPAGPQVDLDLVGIVRRPLDLGERGAVGGLMVLTPAFGRAYAGQIGVFGHRLRIRTVDEGQVDGVLAQASDLLGPSLFSAQSLTGDIQGARSAIDLFASALWITAIVGTVGTLVVIALIVSRELGLVLRQEERLRQLGFTRTELVGVATAWTAPVAIGAAAVAVAGAVLLSPLFPLGIARRADPDVGLHVDGLIVAAGGVGVAILVLLLAAGAAAVRTKPRLVADDDRITRASRLGRRYSARSPALATGLWMASGPDRRGGVAGRPAVIGAVIGVAAIVTASIFVANQQHLGGHPRLYGSDWQFAALDVTGNTPCSGDDYGVPDLAAPAPVTEVCSQNVRLDGRNVTAFTFTALRGPTIEPEIIEGRPPVTPDEVVLGAATLRALGKHVGDTVQASRRNVTADYRIVGVAVLPTLAQAQPLAEGAVFTWAGYQPMYDSNIFTRAFVGRTVPGTDLTALSAAIAKVPTLGPLQPPQVPIEIARLHQVRWLPIALGGLVGSLALLAVGYALVTSVRRQRRALAVLKTFGLTRQQVRTAVAWEATALGVAGLVVGIPLGLIVGRLLWRHVASALGVATITVWPVLAAVLVVPITLALVNLLAFLPARAAARVRPATALRTE
jgi:ABC-type lipoprotein release transport system permease subunit